MYKKRYVYLALTLGKSLSAIKNEKGSFANWVKSTNQFKFLQSLNIVYDTDIIEPYELRRQFNPDNYLVIDILLGHDTNHYKLNKLIELTQSEANADFFHNTMIITSSLFALGNDENKVKNVYNKMLDAKVGILLPDLSSSSGISQFSTCDNDGNYLPDCNSSKYIYQERISKISKADLKKASGRNNRKEFTNSFIDAYYLHQSFLIGDKEALMLSRLSINIFSAKWKQMEQAPFLRIYPYADKEIEQFFDLNELDKKWFSLYSGLCTLDEYLRLPKRCIRLPKDLVIYQNAALLPESIIKNMSIGQISALPLSDDYFNLGRIIDLSVTDDKMKLIHQQTGVPLMNVAIFKKYCIRSVIAKEKRYQSFYNRKNFHLCNAIKSFHQKMALSSLPEPKKQQSYDCFLDNYIHHFF